MKTARIIANALAFFLALTAITGFLYPLAVTGFAQLAFPFQANGSLVREGNAIRGSRLIEQDFASDKYFHGRPSADDSATVPSGASNLSPASALLRDTVAKRKEALQKEFGSTNIPIDLLYASASGLDPDISIDSALLQVDRVAKARSMSESQKAALIEYIKKNPEGSELFPSPARINIIDLNARLDAEK
jgi:potassium-transporting ATPase KdpC subunit